MEMGCPESITKSEFGSGITLVRKNFTPTAFFLLLFCVAWDGFLLFWYFGAPAKEMPLIGRLFPLVHVAVGVGLTYYTVTLFINRTEISVINGFIKVQDIPLPLGNTKMINGDDIAQFYVKEKITRGNDQNSVSYMLMGITRDGKLKKIIKGLHEKEEGLYLEQELEKVLKIAPEPVKGEVV